MYSYTRRQNEKKKDMYNFDTLMLIVHEPPNISTKTMKFCRPRMPVAFWEGDFIYDPKDYGSVAEYHKSLCYGDVEPANSNYPLYMNVSLKGA